MTKMTLSADVAALNPGLPLDRARLPATRRANADRAPLFLSAWLMVKAMEREYRAWPWSEPEAEYQFDAVRHYRFDACWPAWRVAVEVDGGQHAPHGGRHASDGDRDKLNLAASLGWRVLRFSPHQLDTDPHAAVMLVVAALSFGVSQP